MSTAPGWFVIVNPASGSGRGRRRWEDLAAALRFEGVHFEAAITASAGDAEALAAEAVRRGFRQLLAAGGDGTLHEAVNGALSVPGIDGRDLLFAVAPFGTGNDWARGAGLPREPLALARCLARAEAVPCDLGCLDFAAGAAPPRRWFINVAGAGIDTHVLERLPAGRARPLAYLWGVLAALVSFRPPEFDVRADGRHERGRRLLALAANGPYCGNGMRLAPAARPDDGRLELVTVAPLPLLAALRRLPRLFDGRLGQERWVATTRVESVAIDATPPAAVEADGQIVGRTPVRIHVVPGAIRVLAPALGP